MPVLRYPDLYMESYKKDQHILVLYQQAYKHFDVQSQLSLS